MSTSHTSNQSRQTAVEKALHWVERVGNRLPDPAALFLIALVAVWIASWLLAGHEFTDTGQGRS